MAYTQKHMEWAKKEVERQKKLLAELTISVADHSNLTAGEYMMLAMIKHNARRAVAQLETVRLSIQNSAEYTAERTMNI